MIYGLLSGTEPAETLSLGTAASRFALASIGAVSPDITEAALTEKAAGLRGLCSVHRF
jgi:hypothetical protein